MNEIIKALKTRRSIRSYKPDMVSKEDIEQIIEAGLYAANGRGKQAVIVVAITNKELRDQLSVVNREIAGMPETMDPFYGAPVVLAVLAEKEWPTGLYDGSLAIGNMMQAADSLGLGSCWIHRAKEEFEMEEYKQLLKDIGVEGDYIGVGHCIVGYIDGDKPEAAPRNDNRVFWIE